MKLWALARSFIWWPGIDARIENMVKKCTICATLKNNPPKENSNHWEWPSVSWKRIHIDCLGPVQGKMLFLVVDAHSKWPEVFIGPSTTTAYKIQCLASLFARYGYPISLVLDNDPQFMPEEFQHFLRNYGVKYMLSTPHYPATNRQAKKYLQTLQRGLKALSTVTLTMITC